jgi:hypothetical protein
MQEWCDWQALRTCDALVEHAIADGAYPEALDHLIQGYQQVRVQPSSFGHKVPRSNWATSSTCLICPSSDSITA